MSSPTGHPGLTDGAQRQLLAELQGLDTPEILALCLRFARVPDRIALYLRVLRARSGDRAQFAACVACFDLARQGDVVAQREFLALVPTLRELSAKARLVDELIGGDPYLAPLFQECRQAMESVDPIDGLRAMEQGGLVGELDLLSGENIDLSALLEGLDPGQPIDNRSAKDHALARRVIEFLGHDLTDGVLRRGRGLQLRKSEELERFDLFLGELLAMPAPSPLARGLACVGNLYLAVHLRKRSIFGRPNMRRRSAVQLGLSALPGDPRALPAAAALFALESPVVAERFGKALSILQDYVAYCAAQGIDPERGDSVDRFVESQ